MQRQRTPDEWLDIARFVRHAANKLAPAPLPLCLPGEPQACGQDAQRHALGWSAELKALSHHLIEAAADSQEEAAYFAGTFYKERLAALREASPPTT
ncbi:hypothetical protein [Streptantibioticus silvisoli]|uniref:Uncharacterized protein n=1 Tax=Streptantibioticus silvisoli TaxID=2705255 RepID=A0ABT6W0B4_9ACTN|nr:hypothetical protein [Streptantibioticus silvisoli]MDI5963694.1 hypothetical protein [Streptantibioticus silvisoli]